MITARSIGRNGIGAIVTTGRNAQLFTRLSAFSVRRAFGSQAAKKAVRELTA
jgi:hypothetical protein